MSEAVGIIYPPPELRGVVDSMAKFVARNGAVFEEKVLQEHRGKPKFRFLFPDDPFHAYYRHKVNEIRSTLLAEAESRRTQEQEPPERSRGREEEARTREADDSQIRRPGGSGDERQNSSRKDEERDRLQERSDDNGDSGKHQRQEDGPVKERSEPEPGHNDKEREAESTPGVKSTLNEYIQEMTKKLEEPPHLNYLADPASFISHLESDTIKLTAQYIAAQGREFLFELMSREQGNPRFDFLRPQHGQFPYLTRLIMQYALIQNPPLDILEQLERDATSRKHLLDRCKMRAEWNRMLEVERKKKEEAEEREKLLYSQIDWHDFVVVETIDYHHGEVGEYPPTTADQVGTRLLKQQRKEDQSAPEEMDIDMDVESDNESGAGSPGAAEFAAPYPPDEPKLVIRRDYDPKAAIRVSSQPEATYVSPITNERVPAGQFESHMRYNLADPRALKDKEKSLQVRASEAPVFASGSDIQDNLKNLAERRTDLFGVNDGQAAIGQRIDEEKDNQAKGKAIQWDGHKSSLKRKKLN